MLGCGQSEEHSQEDLLYSCGSGFLTFHLLWLVVCHCLPPWSLLIWSEGGAGNSAERVVMGTLTWENITAPLRWNSSTINGELVSWIMHAGRFLEEAPKRIKYSGGGQIIDLWLGVSTGNPSIHHCRTESWLIIAQDTVFFFAAKCVCVYSRNANVFQFSQCTTGSFCHCGNN